MDTTTDRLALTQTDFMSLEALTDDLIHRIAEVTTKATGDGRNEMLECFARAIDFLDQQHGLRAQVMALRDEVDYQLPV